MQKLQTILRNTSLILLLSLAGAQVNAQSLIERAFVSMPDEFYLSLSKGMRKEMVIDYIRDSSSVKKNIFKGESSIQTIDTLNSFIRIKNSEQGTVELKLLHTNDSVIVIALNFTACAPVCDSHLGFFAANWQLLKEPLITTPIINDFLDLDIIKKEGLEANSIAEKFDLTLIEYRFIQNGNDVEATLNCEKLMEAENYNRLKKYLKGNKLKYSWSKGMYEKTACYW